MRSIHCSLQRSNAPRPHSTRLIHPCSEYQPQHHPVHHHQNLPPLCHIQTCLQSAQCPQSRRPLHGIPSRSAPATRCFRHTPRSLPPKLPHHPHPAPKHQSKDHPVHHH